jgi:hypothetical protein
MKKCMMMGVVCLGLLFGASQALANAPLTLYYTYADQGDGTYFYEFYLVVENNDFTYQDGQGFGWLIFGDAQQMSSPFIDFQMDQSQVPVGPWTNLSNSGGYHNGPTFAYVLDTWVPAGVGDYLYWNGVAAETLDQGQMLWSSIYTSGGAHIIEFEQAVQY